MALFSGGGGRKRQELPRGLLEDAADPGEDELFLDLEQLLDDWRPPEGIKAACIFAAMARLAACELRHGGILGTGLPDGCADLVVVHQVLHYLADPAAAAAEAARLVAPGGRLLIVDFAPHELEFLRIEHRHRRLGFFDSEIERWVAAAGLSATNVRSLPPAADGGLTVKIWSAVREAGRVRLIA